jgi:hypothetical protein
MNRGLEKEDKIVYCSRIESTGKALFANGVFELRGLGFVVREGMSFTFYYTVQRCRDGRNKYETENG